MDDINSYLTSYENGVFSCGNIVASSGLFHSGIACDTLEICQATFLAPPSSHSPQPELDSHVRGPWRSPIGPSSTLLKLETHRGNTERIIEEDASYDLTNPSYRSTDARQFKKTSFLEHSGDNGDAENFDKAAVTEILRTLVQRYQKMGWDVPAPSSSVRSALISSTQSPNKPHSALIQSSLEVNSGIQFTEDVMPNVMPIAFLPVSDDTNTEVDMSIDVDTYATQPSTQGAANASESEMEADAEYSESIDETLFEMLDKAGLIDAEARKQELKKEMRVVRDRLEVLQQEYDAIDSAEKEYDDWLAWIFEDGDGRGVEEIAPSSYEYD